MNLKTLKDIDVREDWLKEEIKKEAIKWANHLDKIDDNIREFIKKFFNITSEDLK